MSTWVFDTETLPNRTLFCALNADTGERFDLWRHEPEAPARLRSGWRPGPRCGSSC
jgi:hypothetical protein